MLEEERKAAKLHWLLGIPALQTTQLMLKEKNELLAWYKQDMDLFSKLVVDSIF